MVKFSDKGSGWHKEGTRHSRARKYGTAGGNYHVPTRSKHLRKLTYSQLKKKGVKLSANGDADHDGVRNSKDCRPFNPKMQDVDRRKRIWHDTFFDKKLADEAYERLKKEGRNPTMTKELDNAYRIEALEPGGERMAGELYTINKKYSTPKKEQSSESRELELFIENDADLYRQQEQPIEKNLLTKMVKGQYNSEKAVKLWGYLMDNGARKYNKEVSGKEGIPSYFNATTRRETARSFAKNFEQKIYDGEYDGSVLLQMVPKKYAKNRLGGFFHGIGVVKSAIKEGYTTEEIEYPSVGEWADDPRVYWSDKEIDEDEEGFFTGVDFALNFKKADIGTKRIKR